MRKNESLASVLLFMVRHKQAAIWACWDRCQVKSINREKNERIWSVKLKYLINNFRFVVPELSSIAGFSCCRDMFSIFSCPVVLVFPMFSVDFLIFCRGTCAHDIKYFCRWNLLSTQSGINGISLFLLLAMTFMRFPLDVNLKQMNDPTLLCRLENKFAVEFK